jgi:hypothetical protein
MVTWGVILGAVEAVRLRAAMWLCALHWATATAVPALQLVSWWHVGARLEILLIPGV